MRTRKHLNSSNSTKRNIKTTQLAKMSIDLKFVELTADVLEIFFYNNMTPPIMKKLTHIVYYKYQQRSLQR